MKLLHSKVTILLRLLDFIFEFEPWIFLDFSSKENIFNMKMYYSSKQLENQFIKIYLPNIKVKLDNIQCWQVHSVSKLN